MSQSLARLLVFVTSAAVLVIEILAVRLLAPYLGVSLEVFTGVIGVILAGISFGAWAGGRLADRGEPRRLVGPLVVGGGLAAMASPPVVDFFGPALTSGAGSIVVLALLGFFVPAAVLSAVPPVVVKARLHSLTETGSVVGSYSAVGTAGAIFGTFLTGFFLIAAFPTRPIVLVLGVLLTLGGLTLWSFRGRAGRILTVMALLGAVLALVEGPCEYETTYHCAVIQVDPNRSTGRTLFLDRLPNSYVDVADPTYLEYRYIELMADVIAGSHPDGAVDMISVGGGGFTLPGYVAATRPGGSNVVLEIDESLVEIGQTRLGLPDSVEVIVGDARTTMRDVATESADVVIGDAFSGASVPWHLTTVEFAADIRRVLRVDGVYAMNVIDFGDLRFARAAAAALRDVFDEITVLAPPHYFDGGGAGGNFVLVASDRHIELDAILGLVRGRGGVETGLTDAGLADWIGDAILLRDDYAPVDQILSRRL
ncbi:MAG: fused MFS/spermidine synthase [Actinobacteria bacterium]|nr:fused MFS/spermidine synthase [Actinomycetota bacterium]